MSSHLVFRNLVNGFLPALLSAVLLSSAATASFAQVNVTASAGTATASYTTLGAAFTAINAGTHQGVIGIAIVGNTSEAATASLLVSGGTSSYSQVTISPGAGAAVAITGAIAGPLVDLNGAAHVTIDGLNTGGSSLRIENTSATATASAIRFINGASANTVQNCTVNGAGTAAAAGVITFSTTTAATGNSNNVVTACDIGPSGANTPMAGIYSSGSTTSTVIYNSLNTISNNRIHDYFSTTAAASVFGIAVLTGNSDWTISGNSIYQSATRSPVTTGTLYGIYVANTTNGNNFAITGNFLGGSAVSAGSTPLTVNAGTNAYTYIGISTSATSASVQGNTITNFAWTSGGTPAWRGLYGTAGTLNLGTVTGNTIGAGTGNGAITVNSAATSLMSVYGIDVASGSTSNVANNTIGSFTLNGNYLAFTGINSSVTAGSFTNNLVGSLTTAGSISLTAATTIAVSLTGIYMTGAPPTAASPFMVTGNTIANLTSAATTVGGRGVHGIEVNSVNYSYYTISGNTVRNLSAAATGTTFPPLNATILGIGVSTTAGAQVITQNSIYSLASTSTTGAAVVEGIGMTMSSNWANGAGIVSRNIVHSLTAASSATCTLVGIAASSGGTRYVNNMVRLGLDANGAPVSGPHTFVGLGADGGLGGVPFYFNTVWIGGSAASGSASSYAFYRSSASYTDTLKDNIFVNVRTGGTGRHFALSVNGTTGKTTDYNLYWTGGSANVASLDNGTTTLGTLQAIRGAAAGWDAHSGIGDPLLVAPAAAAGSLSLKLQPLTPAEGSGIDVTLSPAIAGTTDVDQEGDVRASNSPADIGADAGLYAQSATSDAFPPVISVTPLANTSSAGDRTLTATITDFGAGVPASGTLVPRVWYKKSTSPTWTLSNPGTLVSFTGNTGTWNFTISGAPLALAAGDSVQYYVVAQDQAPTPNLWYQPVTAAAPVHSNVNTQTTPPASVLGYRIIGTYAGPYYVPSGPGTSFASLTNAGGFFSAINGGTVSGNITLVVTGDLAAETGAYALNQWLEDGAGGWTLTIQPDAATVRTVSGTAATTGAPLVNLNGADRVTIDGSFGGSGQYLRFRNTSAAATAGPTIQFNNGATYDALKNCIVESNATTTATGEVLIGATGANNNLLVSGNDLRDETAGTPGSPANVIYGNSASISSVTISNNTIHNFLNFGVDFGGTTYNAAQSVGSGITVSGNSFYFDGATAGAYQCAIGIGGGGDGHVVSGNFIGGKAPSCGGAAWSPATAATVYGIGVSASGATTGTSIQGNTIQNWAFNTSLGTFYGIATTTGKFAIGTVAGNVIGHPTTAGSIAITSTAAAAVYGISASGPSVDVRNNLVANLSGAGVNPYLRGISLASTGAGSVQNNTVRNVSLPGTSANSSWGISATGTGPFDVGGTTGNTVSNLGLAVGALSYGINVTSTATTGNVVSHNSVSAITATGTGAWYGISVASPYNATQSTVQGNTVQGITLTNAAAGEFRGLSAAGNPGATNGFGPASMTGNVVGSDASANSIVAAGTGATTGIWVEGYGNSFSGLDDLSNCTIANLTASGTGAGVSLRGIYVTQASASVPGGYVGMSNVNIHDLQTASTGTGDGATAPALAGIWLLGAQAPYVQGCSIHGLRATTTAGAGTAVDGIWASGGIGTLQRNRIWDLTNTSTSTAAVIRGVYQFGGSWTLTNNEIALTNGANTNPVQVLGIAQNLVSGIGAGNLYYNSVYIGGSQASGASGSFGFQRQAGFVDVLTDNLLLNARSNTGSATGSHYALGSALAGAWTSNYNVLVAPAAAKLALWTGTDATLAAWQSASAGDANSLGETAANVPPAQMFADPANGVLDVKPTTAYDAPPIVSNAGTPVAGVGSDFGGADARSASAPDVGADEITVSRTLTTAGSLQAASPSYAGNYDDIAISGAGAPVLAGNVSVFGTLSLGGGNLTTGPQSMTIAPSGSVVRTSGSVVGTLRKYFPVSASSAANFEVGSGGDYAYVRVTLAPVSTAGYVSATTTGSDHPQLAGSILDPARDVNRWWTLASNGAAFGTASVTPHFVSTDLDAGTDPTTFRAARYDGTSWSVPAVGTRTATSTQLTGLTALGDIALGNTTPLVITASAGAGGSISPVGQVGASYGGSPVFTLTPDAHHHVADVLVDGASVGAPATYTFTNVAANHTIAATFAIDTYPIVATSGVNGSVTPADTTAAPWGSSQAYAITPAEHYHVADVLVDGASVGAVTAYTFTGVAAAHSISVTFAIDTYTVTTGAGTGGSVTPAGDTSVDWNASLAVAITPDPHYHVVDVLVDGASAGAVTDYTFTDVAANHTLSATFAIDTSTITATSGPGGAVTPAGDTSVGYGGSQAYAITAGTGFHVVDVLVDGGSVGAVTAYTFENVTDTHTISASFAINTYTITASSNAGGALTPGGPTTLDHGASQAYSITPDAHHHVADVLVDGASVGTPATYTFTDITTNHTIAATFAIDTYPIVATSGVHGSVTPADTTAAPWGSSQAYAITPAAHYHVADVLVDGASVGAVTAYTFTGVAAAHSISATFAIDAYTVTTGAGTGGSVSPDGDTSVNWNAPLAVAITPDAHHHVVDVLVDGASVGAATAYTFTNVAANHTLSATFAIDTYSITATTTAGGSITPSGVTTLDWNGGQGYTLSADPGHVLVDLVVDGASVGTPVGYTFANVAANHTISAQYQLIMNPAPVSAVSPAGTLSSSTPLLLVPVTISRNYPNPVRAFHVTFHLSPELALAGGMGAIAEGGFLASGGDPTTFHVADEGGGSYSVDASVLGANCTATAPGGTLFEIPVSSASPSGPGTVTVTNVALRDCANVPLPATTGSTANVSIDNAAPVVALTSPSGGEFLVAGTQHTITWSAADNVGVSSVDLALSLDGGATWPVAIATGIANSGGLPWTVPATLTTSARVRVSAHDAAGNTGVSSSASGFTIGQWALVATTGDHGAVTPTGTTGVSQGGAQAYAITPDAHYHVEDVLVDGASVGAVTAYTFSAVSANHTISATFAIDVNTITASAGPDGAVTPSGATSVPYAGSQAYAITADAHHHVADVLVDGLSVGAVTAYTFTGVTVSHTISATFAVDVNTITASAGPDGAVTPSGATNVPYAGSQAYAITADAHHHVADVLVDGLSVGAVAAYTFTGVTAPHTISATFAIDTYAITASTGGDGSVTPAGVTDVPYGGSQAYVIAAEAHYHVADVRVDGATVGAVTSYTFTNVAETHTISATFVLDTYAITATSGGDGSVSPAGVTNVAYGGSQAYSITPAVHYHVADVFVDSTSVGAVSAYTFTGVTAAHTISATFAIDVNTITASAGPDGTVTPAGATSVPYAGSQVYAIIPAAHHHVADVLVDGSSAGAVTAYTFTNVTVPHTISATFAIDTYTITAGAGAGGGITPDGAVAVNWNASQAFTIVPNTHWHVADVLVDGASVGAVTAYTFTNVVATHTITATFAIDVNTITASAGPDGAVTPAGVTSVPYGGSQAYAITAAAHHHVADVLVDGLSAGAVTAYTFTGVVGSHTIAATFAIDSYTLTAGASPGGSITPSGAVVVDWNGSQSFVIAPDLHFHVADVLVDGTSVGAVTGYTFPAVSADHTISAVFAANPPVAAITTLSATRPRTGNAPGNTAKINVTWSGVPAGATVEVYRAGFGNYPLYASGATPGSIPTVPASYPPAGWTLTALHQPGDSDLPAARDFYYYIAYVIDSYGTVSPVSNRTGGTLDYHLGDVSNGITLGTGDDHVTLADLSLLGANYGQSGVGASEWNYLDVGPTTDLSLDAMPATDGKLNFEDLVLFAINFGVVSAPQDGPALVPSATDGLTFEAPEQVGRGDVVTVRLRLTGTGSVHALSAALAWDPEVVTPAGFEAGAMVAAQGGAMLSPAPGSVDGALLGPDRRGFLGDGEFATLTFRALKDGAPRLAFAHVDARDGSNSPIRIAATALAVPRVPLATSLSAPAPNPAPGGTTIAFGLSRSGAVDLALYSVDGRRVRTLAHGPHAANTYRIGWDGRDDAGRTVAPGVYFARLATTQGTFVREVVMIR